MIPIRHGSKKPIHIPTSLYKHNQIGFEDNVPLYLHLFPPLPYMPNQRKNNDNDISAYNNLFRFNFQNSHLISLSNSLASRHTLEVIFKTFFTGMRLRYLQSVFYKGSYNFPHRQIKVVQTQIVVVLYREMIFMEIAFQNSCRLCSIRERKPDMLTAFCSSSARLSSSSNAPWSIIPISSASKEISERM